MILFIDQSGELGGAELCLGDLAIHRKDDSSVLLLADGPFASYLRDRQVSVQTLPMPSRVKLLTKDLKICEIASAVPALVGHMCALRETFKSADLLYFNTAKALLEGVAAKAFLRKPAIFHLHDLLIPSHFSKMAIRVLVAAANRTQAVIANSQATADAFMAAGGRIHPRVVPNGFDPSLFNSTSEERSMIRTSLGAAPNQTVAAIFGRLSRWKGQDLLIKAAERDPELRVWIVGEALFTGDDSRYADELRQMVKNSGLEKRVIFLGFRSDIPALMQAADIIVHASRQSEPFGRVIVEGMLAGKPVIAARAGGPLEIIQERQTGLLFNPEDVSELATHLQTLGSNPPMASELGKNGRARAMEQYAIHKVLRDTDQIIEAVLEATHG